MKVVIIGGGQIGTYIAQQLIEANNEVTIIEKRSKPLGNLNKIFPSDMIIEGDGADPQFLEMAGINNADVVASVTGADEVNLVASTIAKFEYGVPRVIGRVNNPKNEWLFTEAMGIDVKVSQANLLSNIILEQIDVSHMVTLMRLNQGENAIVQATIQPNAQAVGIQIKDLMLPEDTILFAVKRDNQTLVPKGDTVLLAHDLVLAYMSEKGEETFFQLLKPVD
ncbi:potassium channel family protein [Enterococcus sp. DIV0876]|uniref:potassium channel family protein n=1 Tax=Enterococcus sp. DIV0876 TaxID=2774633 RepID=UPI003D2FF38E